ncbi:hypothetical protein AB5I39_12595 [Sphingomonas sp. MMS24-J45]|uniref:hypothetical protein n=1 Tax=Sphingomonas sp. MMS24-J45 TaxID=3238806 RepID=UPI00384BB688
MSVLLDRRALLIGGGLLGLTAAAPGFALAARGTPVTETIDLTVSATRSTKMTIWRPTVVRGVALFSTGHGSWPERYERLAALLVANGFAVLAPLHVDSMQYPDRAKFGMMNGFLERFADLRATSGYADGHFAGLPIIAVGHSFGSLVSMCLGGALPYMGKLRNPAVKAVLCFSSPGKIPNLVQPTAYAGLAVPTMLVTGTKDLVTGWVTDPADHLFPIESAPAGDKFGLVIGDGDHGLVANAAAFARAEPAVTQFVRGYGLNQAAARRRLKAFRAADGDRFIDREQAA